MVGTKGYAATSVGDIIRFARVSRSTFYEQFPDKEHCFIAAYEERARLTLEHVREGCEQAGSSMQRIQAGIRALLAVLADEPAYARMALVEVLAAGPVAAASRDRVHGRFVELLVDWHAAARRESEAVPAMPEDVLACAVGGVGDLLARTVREGGTERLPALAPVIVTFLLTAAAVPAGRDLAAALSVSRARRGSGSR